MRLRKRAQNSTGSCPAMNVFPVSRLRPKQRLGGEVQHSRHHLGTGGEVAVDLNIDVDSVCLGRVHDHAIALLHQLHGLIIGEPFGLQQAVGRRDVGAGCNPRPGQRLEDVGDPEIGPVPARKGIGGVHLGKMHPIALHLLQQQERVFRQGDMGEVSQTVDPGNALDDAGFDVVDVVLLGPLQGLLKAKGGRVESVSMKTDFHRGIPPQQNNCLITAYFSRRPAERGN